MNGSLRRAGATLIILTILAKMVGLVREMVVASTYGTTGIVDAYLAASTVPLAIATLLYNAVPNAIVPMLTGTGASRRGKHGAIRATLVFAVVAAAGVWLAAGPIASLTNRGFPAPVRSQTVVLVRVMAIAVLVSAVEALARSRLLAGKRFVQTGVASIWESGTIVLAVLCFPGGGASTLSWGLVVGMTLMALWCLIPPLRARSATVPPSVHRDDSVEGASSAGGGRWLAAVLFVGVVGLIYGLVDRYYGSYLPEGSIAGLQYANVVASQVVALCGMTLGTALFPFLAERIGAGDRASSGDVLDRAITWSLLGSVPAAWVMMLLGTPVVTLLFERGVFAAGSRQMTATLLGVYGLWLIPAAVTPMVGSVFYSTRRWRPMLISILVAIVVKGVCSAWWVRTAGVAGLAAATAVSAWFALAAQGLALPGWAFVRHWRGWLRHIVALSALSTVACLTGRLAGTAVPLASHHGRAALALAVALAVGLGGLLWLGPRWGISGAATARSKVARLWQRRIS